MANTNKTSLLQNNPVIQPTEVIVEVVFPTSGAAVAYTTGGDFADITSANILDPSDLGAAGPNQTPIFVETVDQGTDGSYSEWIPGTTLANGKVRLWTAGGTEFSGNYAAPWVTGNVLLRILLNSDDR